MPLYEYECDACGKRFEKIQKFSDPPADVCVHCGKGPLRKLLSSPAIQFKGSGWYITDYAKKSSSGASKEAKESKDSKESKETKESKDSKSATTDTKSATSPDKSD
jgi:putative FmdB family regulatory protein